MPLGKNVFPLQKQKGMNMKLKTSIALVISFMPLFSALGQGTGHSSLTAPNPLNYIDSISPAQQQQIYQQQQEQAAGQLGRALQASIACQAEQTRLNKEDASEGVVNSSPVTGGITIASGTGFFVTDDGYLISNNHVVKDAVRVCLRTSAGLIDAKVVQVDADNDLALLKAEGKFSPLPIAESGVVKLGGTVATIGFPNIEMQGFSPKLTKGEISSTNGFQDDPRYFQISVPVQPGNSGGALVDERGNVIGIVSAKLSARVALATSGALPEDVNYAVKSSLLLSFLESALDISAKLKAPFTADRKFEDVVKSAQDASVLVGVVEMNRECNTARDNAGAQGAAEFEREFYARYPNLKPYAVIANSTANQLTANGMRGTKDGLMEAFAKATREEIQRLLRRIEEINNTTPLPQPPRANFPAYGGVNVNQWVDNINQQNAAADAHKQRMAAYDESDRFIQQQIAKYLLEGQMGLGQAAILALATPEEIKVAQDAAQARAIADKKRAMQGQIDAVRWLQPQATNGDASAQCSLGLHYLNGQGCETNREQAIYWLQKAADQGNFEASNKLVSLQK
jgi:S1-C subfamily serine protease